MVGRGKNQLGAYNPLPITFNGGSLGNWRLFICFAPDFIFRVMFIDIHRRGERAGVVGKLWGKTKFLSMRNRFGDNRKGNGAEKQ